ncbi:DUF7935 family protein [Aquimarina pacifica]|uniref:DUF7935 family protein n=1 Tax=Aquimarina pacifica TaxID=1296415 RepID=UPI000472D925|nr:hypothetical protein [Aquimarina pacifica]
MEFQIIPLVISLIPSLLVTLLAVYFFKLHTANEDKQRRFLLHKENQKEVLPIKFQAYERLVLFLERISPDKLLIRVQPLGDDKKGYESLLTQTIDQEFEHNLTQQIYVSDESWNTIKAAKNATIGIIRKVASKEDIQSANKMREVILTELVEKGTPSEAALTFLKKEINYLI